MDYIGNNTNSIEWAQGRNEGYIPDGSLRLITDNDDIKFSKETNIDSEYKVGTIVLANSEGDKHFLYPWDMNGDLLDVDNMLHTEANDYGYYPIGIIVVPASHTPNGIARMMYKSFFNNITIENGIGQINELNLKQYDTCMVIGTDYEAVGADEGSTLPEVQIPSDRNIYYDSYMRPSFDTETVEQYGDGCQYNPYDQNCGWDHDGEDGDALCPSPYLTNGKKNELYHLDKFSIYHEGEGETYDYNNALSDMDGKNNTSAIRYGSENSFGALPEDIDYCLNFKTYGTNKGDWYVPSLGEVGYLLSRASTINTVIDLIDSQNSDKFSYGYTILTSTIYDGVSRWVVETNYHTTDAVDIDTTVIPFSYVL
jgi:hypothetical protein